MAEHPGPQPKRVFLDQPGLKSAPNKLKGGQQGALLQATNVMSRSPGELSTRFGFQAGNYDTNSGNYVNDAVEFNQGNTVYSEQNQALTAGGLRFYAPGVRPTVPNQGLSTQLKNPSGNTNSNLSGRRLLNVGKGVLALSQTEPQFWIDQAQLAAGTSIPLGIPQPPSTTYGTNFAYNTKILGLTGLALYPPKFLYDGNSRFPLFNTSAFISPINLYGGPPGTTTGAMPGIGVAYRVVYRWQLADGTSIYSPPSDRITLSNLGAPSAASSLGTNPGNVIPFTSAGFSPGFWHMLPRNGLPLGPNFFVQFYRTLLVTGYFTGITYSEDYYLVGEASTENISATTSYAAWAFNNNTGGPTGLPSASLVIATDSTAQMGPAGVPGVAIQFVDQTPDAFAVQALYTNASDGNGSTAAAQPAPISATSTIFYGRTYYGNVTQPPVVQFQLVGCGGTTGLQGGDLVVVNGQAFQAVSMTALVNFPNYGSTIPTLTSTQFLLEDRTTTFTPTQCIQTTAINLVQAINNFFTPRVGTAVSQAWEPIPTVQASYASTAGSFPGNIKIVSAIQTNGIVPNVTVSSPSPSAATAWSPALNPAVTAGLVNSSGMLAFSDPAQPWMARQNSYTTVGQLDKAILALVGTRDSLFVFKEDGLFRLNGTDPTSTPFLPFDPTLRVVGPRTCQPFDNNVVCLCERGVLLITEAGARSISIDIDDILDGYSLPPYRAEFAAGAFVVPVESQNFFLLFLPQETGIATCNFAIVHNTKTNTWTATQIRGLQNARGIVGGNVDITTNQTRLFNYDAPGQFAVGAGPYVERLNDDNTDYADPDFNIAGTLATVGGAITLTETDTLGLIEQGLLLPGDNIYGAAGGALATNATVQSVNPAAGTAVLTAAPGNGLGGTFFGPSQISNSNGDYGATPWLPHQVTTTGGQLDPLGGTGGYLITDNAVNDQHYTAGSTAITPLQIGLTYLATAYFKPGTYTVGATFYVGNAPDTHVFVNNSGVATGTGASITNLTSIAAPNGYFKVTWNFVANNAGYIFIQFGNGGPTYAGSGQNFTVAGFYVQLPTVVAPETSFVVNPGIAQTVQYLPQTSEDPFTTKKWRSAYLALENCSYDYASVIFQGEQTVPETAALTGPPSVPWGSQGGTVAWGSQQPNSPNQAPWGRNGFSRFEQVGVTQNSTHSASLFVTFFTAQWRRPIVLRGMSVSAIQAGDQIEEAA